MELRHTLRAQQQLALSPRLYQSLKVLRLSAADLAQLIQKELNENPALDIPEPSDYDLEPGAAAPDGGQSVEVELWRDMAAAGRDETAPERRDPFRPGVTAGASDLATTPVTLDDHLTLQLNLQRLPEQLRRDGLAIIGSLDGDGFLRESAEQVAATVNRPEAEIDAALAVIQSFDPPGVGARDLEECLLIQLRQLRATEIPMKIVQEYLPLVARGALKEIAKALSAPLPRVERAVALIRSLNPSPGSLFDVDPPAAMVIPDVFVNMQHGRARVLANREILPSLHVSALYRQIAAKAKTSVSGRTTADGRKKAAATSDGAETDSTSVPAADPEAVAYIREKILEASRLIRDIDQRRATVTRVARAIADAQPDFFKKGPGCLRPLNLEKIAAVLEVHPSTISRAILGKYMSTPYGIFELRYFLSAGYAACGAGGKGLAATAVRQRLKKLIEDEDELKPLSDQKLTELLKKDEIPISRRTVAKYREEMGIPPSWDRKQKV